MKVAVVMPAYNAEKTLEKTYNDIPKDAVDDIILVDDCSRDRTVEIAKKLPIKIYVHKQNKGYGGNQKTCYDKALQRGADIVVLLHPDYQYDPKKIPEMVGPLKTGEADIVYGSRMLDSGGAKSGNMPWLKRFGNFWLTLYFNLMLGTKFTDVATGYIAYSKKVLTSILYHDNSDGFTFDEEAIIQCVSKGFRIKEIAVPTKYEEDSSTTSFSDCVAYTLRLSYRVARYKLTGKT